ncbi:MAG: type II toxin-antitoxin system HicB family antitoxin [Pyrinomonadaceae bacterium]
MTNHFDALFQQDGEWIIGYCPEVPGANGQGRTLQECRDSLAEAISLLFEDQGISLDPTTILFNQEI